MISEEYINRLRHRLERLNRQQKELESEHKGREHQFTYYGGHTMGYIKGKIAEIEDFLAEWETPFYY